MYTNENKVTQQNGQSACNARKSALYAMAADAKRRGLTDEDMHPASLVEVLHRAAFFCLAKAYDLATGAANLFAKSDLNDLSLLHFKLMALDEFAPFYEGVELDKDYDAADAAQKDVLMRIHDAGGVAALGVDHPLMAEYITVSAKAIEVAKRVNAMYRKYVVLKNIL